MVSRLKRSTGIQYAALAHALIAMTVLLLCASRTAAQEPSGISINITQAVERAQANLPTIRAAQAQKSAAEAGVDLAKTAYVPRADLLWQENLATRNNVFGLLMPQSTIPSISGPGLASNSYQGAWGSAGGLLVSWEPFDFGLRKGSVGVAQAITKQADADIEVTRFEASISVADAFLTVLANEQVARAAQANVDRFVVFSKIVGTLVANQLRPGVDVSRSEAELASARNQLIQAQQNVELARASFAEALGQAGVYFLLDAGPLLELPPPITPPSPDFTAHPRSLAQMAALDVVHAREHALDRSYFPRFNVQGAVFARGSGALLTGGFDYSKGYYPDTPNWATGITITFNVSDVFNIRARKKMEAGNVAAEQARYDHVINTLKAQDSRARTLIESARRMAENTPIQVKAAQETLERARVRYEYGLANMTEVADAQRLMTQAEIDDSVAKIGIWRALLAVARLGGDLRPFLNQVANTPVKRRQ